LYFLASVVEFLAEQEDSNEQKIGDARIPEPAQETSYEGSSWRRPYEQDNKSGKVWDGGGIKHERLG
jgi:DNA-binding protein H-NS